MNVLCRGDVLQDNLHVFQSVASLDENNQLLVTFEGKLLVFNAYAYLHSYQNDLERLLPPPAFNYARNARLRTVHVLEWAIILLLDGYHRQDLLVGTRAGARSKDRRRRLAKGMLTNIAQLE